MKEKLTSSELSVLLGERIADHSKTIKRDIMK